MDEYVVLIIMRSDAELEYSDYELVLRDLIENEFTNTVLEVIIRKVQSPTPEQDKEDEG